MTSQLLLNAEQAIDSQVSAKNKKLYKRVVFAGMKIMFDKKTHANMQLVQNPESRKDPVNTIASGIAGLMQLLYIQSKKTLPPEVVVMAGMTLMFKAMDFAERGLQIPINKDIINSTTKRIIELLFTKLGVSEQQLQAQIEKGRQQIIDYKAQNPDKFKPTKGAA